MVYEREADITEWRDYVSRLAAVDGRDVDELEAHLRDQIADLDAAGLEEDESFLIAVKRMGKLDDLSREFAREHSGRLWRQLVVDGGETADEGAPSWKQAVGVAVVAALVVQAALRIAGFPDEPATWLLRSISILGLGGVAAYFALRRGLDPRRIMVGAGVLAVAALVVNAYPFADESDTEILVLAHLPVVVWFVVAWAYMNGELGNHARRMDFVRFTGEWTIYGALISNGGGVLVGLTALILEPVGAGLAEAVFEWMVPSGMVGTVVIAAWLVESKQRVIENMAPVLVMLFTPLFALVLAGAAITYVFTGFSGAFDRELLGIFDALMVVVLGLVLYGLSARDDTAEAGWADRLQFIAVVSALVLDVMVLISMFSRIVNLGFTPNRAVALGLNLILLVNLAEHARRSVAFLRGQAGVHHLIRWQTTYLPVFVAWPAAVVVLLPVLFAFG